MASRPDHINLRLEKNGYAFVQEEKTNWNSRTYTPGTAYYGHDMCRLLHVGTDISAGIVYKYAPFQIAFEHVHHQEISANFALEEKCAAKYSLRKVFFHDDPLSRCRRFPAHFNRAAFIRENFRERKIIR